MRTSLALLALPALILGTVAADDTEFAPCGDDLDHPVLAEGDSLSESPSGVESFSFYVDPTVTERGRVSVDAQLVWENMLNDWDLDVNGSVSENYQPFDPATENVAFSARGDCTLVTVSVVDFLAPFPELGMTLDVSVR